MHDSLDDALGFQPPTYPFEKNSNYVQTNAPTSSRPFSSNSLGFCGQKTLFLIFLKAIIDFLSNVVLNSCLIHLAFNHHHQPLGKWVKIQKIALQIIFKSFAIISYIQLGTETTEKPQDVSKTTIR